MKVKIDFCDFWPGFNKNQNFFCNLLRRRFDVEICDGPDFLFYADPKQHAHRIYNCVKIYFGIEADLPDWSECDYAFTSHYLSSPAHFRLPYYLLTGSAALLTKGKEDWAAIMAAKTRFCGFVVSNAHPKKTRRRIEFFQRLSQYKKVDSVGTALNNTGYTLPPGSQHKQEFLKTCKFNIAFENAAIPGYTTEKIVEAMQARCLPIYWGDPRISEEFNPQSFLNYADFPSEDALIEKIIELDQDDAKYLEYMQRPYFHHNTPNATFDIDRMLNQFEKIFTAKIQPVSTRRQWLQIGRWIPVKKKKLH
ncbi:MAG TPA: glycosyltransferase family 10 [Verrucomicrobiae bacterium]|jgi:hypothetical protein|nr:glycosyltransferase family 10 [Verrucomicrobiae bacterium]